MAEAKVTLGMDTRPFEQGAAKATSTIDQISIFAAAKFAAVQKVVSSAMDTAAQIMQAAASKMQASLIDSAIKAKAFNDLQIDLSKVYQNATLASGAIAAISKVSASMDISRDAALEIGRALAKAGVRASELSLAVGVLANISAAYGTNAKAMGDIYSTVFTRGKLSLSELNAMTEAGIPIQQQLARQMHVGFTDVINLTERGKVTAGEFVKALRNMGASDGMGNGSGMMSKAIGAGLAMLETFDGKVRKIQETFKNLAVDVLRLFVGDSQKKGDSPLDKLKTAVMPALDAIQKGLSAIYTSATGIAGAVSVFLAEFGKGPSMIDVISSRLNEFLSQSTFLQSIPQRIQELMSSVASGIKMLLGAISNGDLIEIIKASLWNMFSETINKATSFLIKEFKAAWDFVSTEANTVATSIKNWFQAAIDVFKGPEIDGFSAKTETIGQKLKTWFEEAIQILKNPKTYADIATELSTKITSAISVLGKAMNGIIDDVVKYMNAAFGYAIQEIGNNWKGDSTFKWIIGEQAGIGGSKTFSQFKAEAGLREDNTGRWKAKAQESIAEIAKAAGSTAAKAADQLGTVSDALVGYAEKAGEAVTSGIETVKTKVDTVEMDGLLSKSAFDVGAATDAALAKGQSFFESSGLAQAPLQQATKLTGIGDLTPFDKAISKGNRRTLNDLVGDGSRSAFDVAVMAKGNDATKANGSNPLVLEQKQTNVLLQKLVDKPAQEFKLAN